MGNKVVRSIITGFSIGAVLLSACALKSADEDAPEADAVFVSIPLSSAGESASRAATPVDIGLGSQLQDDYVTYYEAIFKHTDDNGTPSPADDTIRYYVGSAKNGEAFLTVPVMPGTDYEVLVLAGTPANNAKNGEKVLLGSGYRAGVSIVKGQRNIVTVRMYGLDVGLSVRGVKKGAITNYASFPAHQWATNPANPPRYPREVDAEDLAIQGVRGKTRFVQLEKAVLGPRVTLASILYDTFTYQSNDNPWFYAPGKAYKRLTVEITLGNLTPLLYAANRAYSATQRLTPFVPIAIGGGGHEVRIDPLSYRFYTMEPIIIDRPIYFSLLQNIPIPTPPTDWLDPLTHVPIVLQYEFPTANNNDVVSYIPTEDAAGVFSFNLKYYPFSTPDTVRAGAGEWFVRNRVLLDAGGFYGGGVLFLFGNVGTEEVIVDPQ